MLGRVQRMPAEDGRRLAGAAQQHPAADPTVVYEQWYLKRWHCLPEGYLSARSVRLWDAVMRRVYTCGQEGAVARAIASQVTADRMAARILDVGCGAGTLLARLRRQSPGIEVAGADLSPFAVERANARLGVDDEAPVRHSDARALPWPDCSFDAVVASHVLGHVPPEVAAQIVREALRVLAPGGRLVTVDHAWHPVIAPDLAQVGQTSTFAGVVRVRVFARAAT